MLLLIDNYDSFTYNLVHYLGELGAEVAVHRNDALSQLLTQVRRAILAGDLVRRTVHGQPYWVEVA